MCGNNSTSLIDGESVKSMTSRSMPIPMPARRWHAVLERANVIVIERHGLVVAGFFILDLCPEALRLDFRVIELGKTVRDFSSGDKQLKTIGDERVRIILARQRRNFGRVLRNECRFAEFMLARYVEYLSLQLAGSVIVLHRDAELFANLAR